MLLLITDTSGKDGFVGLVRAGEAGNESPIDVVEEIPLAGGTFSAQLVPQISALLNQHGVRKPDIGAFIVVSGPGSFTGLRVGLAAIKAFAEILHRPIVPVSLLEVIALESGAQSVWASLDAGRGEVYFAEYRVIEGVPSLLRERLLRKDEFRSSTVDVPVATPDSALAEIARQAGIRAIVIKAPRAEAVARLGWSKLQRGETVAPEQLDANYVRRSDAEIFKPIAGS